MAYAYACAVLGMLVMPFLLVGTIVVVLWRSGRAARPEGAPPAATAAADAPPPGA
jgi:hypothetical protein